MDGSVGTRLREARTRRRLSLDEVEAATKIRSRYLRAIENDDWEQLPGDIYARAFVRTYANLVGLDGDRLAEAQRRARGVARPEEGLAGVDSGPRNRRGERDRPRLSPRLVALIASALAVAALLAIGLSTGGESGGTSGPARPGLGDAKAVAPAASDGEQGAVPAGHSLSLFAKGEVWVCLLDGQGRALVDGQILYSGDTEGPFRSGSFTLALGNGALTMSVDGKQASTPEPPSPIGFAVDGRGDVRELPAGERPTCT